MRRNNDLIQTSDLLGTVVERIETCYAQDISLLICYGSYVTGSYGARSDIDFFFVPKTQKGYELNCQFILEEVGYDLWSVSWERLTNISNLEEQIASILMDGEVLFASTEEDLRRLEALKDNLRQKLANPSLAGKVSARHIDRAKAIYFDLQDREENRIIIGAMNIVESLLFAVAILNGTYTRKGLKRIAEELGRFSMVPVDFLETYRKLTRTDDTARVQHLVHELIVETDKLWKTRFEESEAQADISELAGFYEEFKSIYNKLLLACDEKNHENAYYAAFLIDRETQELLEQHTGPGIFPNMLGEVLRNDFETVRAGCVEHERQLVELLNRNRIGINAHTDRNAFRRYFLQRPG